MFYSPADEWFLVVKTVEKLVQQPDTRAPLHACPKSRASIASRPAEFGVKPYGAALAHLVVADSDNTIRRTR
jgi:hypothetical protein